MWQKAHALSLSVSALCDRFASRKPGLAKQLERAAEAIAAHISEGRGRATDRDFSHFLSMAIGSANEAENHLQKAFDYRLITAASFESHLVRTVEVRKMLIGLKKKLDGREKGPE
ncbi:MAG TPA: four helix bundle protein [Gemmatimonadaceae bacterium]|nr:four helix bundle protein [Gemmatimonadaceae bacterium]